MPYKSGTAKWNLKCSSLLVWRWKEVANTNLDPNRSGSMLKQSRRGWVSRISLRTMVGKRQMSLKRRGSAPPTVRRRGCRKMPLIKGGTSGSVHESLDLVCTASPIGTSWETLELTENMPPSPWIRRRMPDLGVCCVVPPLITCSPWVAPPFSVVVSWRNHPSTPLYWTIVPQKLPKIEEGDDWGRVGEEEEEE